MQQMGLRLPVDVIARLDNLAKETGRSKTYYAREAILEQLDDMEDLYLAEKRLEDIRAGRSMVYSLEEGEAELGLVDQSPHPSCFRSILATPVVTPCPRLATPNH